MRLNYYTTQDVTVRVKTFDGTASSILNADFHAFDDTITIPAGEKEKSVSLVTFNHFDDQDTDKNLTVKIVSATGAEIITDELSVTIQASVEGPFLGKVNKIALGTNHTCALLQDGRIQCWGAGTYAQVGSITTKSYPVEVVTDSGATDIASFANNTCVTYANGSANCWGENTYYNISDTLGGGYTLPQRTQATTANIKQYSTGKDFSCFITNAGAIYCRGNHTYGQTGCTGVLGSNYANCLVTPPVAVTASQMDSGSYHSCAIMSDESVICWGSNWHGVLGYGTIGTSYGTPSTTLSAGSTATQVTVGEKHTCVLTSAGAVYCWGNNSYNQLGQAATSGDTMTPTAVVGLPEVITKIAAGLYHTCALGTSGKVYCWGYNATGATGTGTASDFTVPTEIANAPGIATDVDAGGYHSCLVSNGDVYCWGQASNLQVSTRESVSFNKPSDPYIFAKTAVKKILSGPDETLNVSHTCAQLSNNGIACTGDNFYGQLGINSLTPFSYTSLNYPTVSNLISDFVIGLNHTCALLINGGVECWGDNSLKQVSPGFAVAKVDPPVAPAVLSTNITQLVSGRNHNCALTSGGDVYCWGDYTKGQTGTCSSSDSPVLVSGLTNVASIAAGGNTNCAIQTDGKVECWGDSSYAQYGRDYMSTNCLSNITPINALFQTTPTFYQETVEQISLGLRHGCGITTSKQLKCWGSDGYGQIGSGLDNVGTKLAPYRIESMDNAKQVLASKNHTCAIDSDGGVKCWGYNLGGLTGVNNTSDDEQFSLDPTDTYGLNYGVEKIYGSELFTCAVTDRGFAKCWGSFYNQQPVLAPRRVYAP